MILNLEKPEISFKKSNFLVFIYVETGCSFPGYSDQNNHAETLLITTLFGQ